jgi:hypothetical protein
MRTLGSLAILCCLLGGNPVIVNDREARHAPPQSPRDTKTHAFHDGPPTEPLPPTLDPAQFRFNRAAFVAYALAARIRETLYQAPCYCKCDREAGHRSLLDCFVGKHGAMCNICQKEAIFCYVSHERKMSPQQIRQAMEKGGAFNLDLPKNVERFYQRMGRKTR